MKKFLTALLAVVMIASTVSIASFADVTPITIKAPTISAAAGATVEIPITVENVGADALRGALFEVKVDGGLQITKKALKPAGSKQTFDVEAGTHVRLFWVGEKDSQVLKSGDTLATITVEVPKTAKEGDTYNVTIIPSPDPGNFFGGDNFTGVSGEPAYGAVAANGKIVVGGVTPGDVNNDNRVNAKDIIAVMKFMLGNAPEGFNQAAADLNSDGRVNAKDIILIMKIMLGGK